MTYSSGVSVGYFPISVTNPPSLTGVTSPETQITTTQLIAYDTTTRKPNCQYGIGGSVNPAASFACAGQAMTDFGFQATRTLTGYDIYGNPQTITVDATNLDDSRTTTTTFGADGYFPATVTNPLLQTIATVIEPREGNPTRVTDANGLIMAMAYDPFGREIETWHPNVFSGQSCARVFSGQSWTACSGQS